MMFWISLLQFLIVPACGIAQKSSPRKLLVILADGFRPSYLDYGDLPGLNRFSKRGVMAKYMEPVFPSNTYPNMYTLVTGLYPESHGMVDNIMMDEEKQDWFLMHPHSNASLEHWWQGAEPVWVTATKATLKCAVFWWFGCEVLIRNIQPMLCEHPKSIYNWSDFYGDVNYALTKIADMFSKDSADLGLLYYEDLDYRGHKYGPESVKIKTAVKKLDDILVKFWKTIDLLNLQAKVNVVLVSDHGMISTDSSSVKYVELSSVINPKDIKIMFGLGSSAGILPLPGKTTKVLAALQGIDGIQAYAKGDLPERLHIKKGSLLAPITVIANKGYFIKKLSDKASESIFLVPEDQYWKGFHGYDAVNSPEMHAVFYAVGPDFKQGFLADPIKSVDVYNLICHLVALDPLPNNGTWDNVKSMLKSVDVRPIQRKSNEL